MDFMKIFVIEAIGLHLGYLGCYGNDWVATPNLDRLATEGIVFDWHFADQPELHPTTPWRQRSVGTGRYAGVISTSMKPRVVRCESLSSFADDALRALCTNDAWLWIEGPSLLPPWNLDDELLEAYFDEDDVEEGLVPWINPPLDLVKLNEADVLQLQNTYAAVVTVFDAQLGVLLDCLREQNSLDDILVCVTARSGLPLGEHGMIGAPRPWLHDELVHVPMLMRLPKAAEAGSRIAALTQPVDLLPTFLDALSQTPPLTPGPSPARGEGRQGLWPLIRGEVDAVRPYAVSSMCVNGHESWLLRTPDWALHLPVAQPDDVAPRSPQLFVKPDDRWEVNDLYQQQIESADIMEKTLRAFMAAIRQPGALVYPTFDEL
jgi:arylsulfatase A-like enzyme